MNKLDINNTVFENIKHIDDNGMEYWSARELQQILNYTQWRRFNEVIKKAKKVCEMSRNNILDHFANVGKMVKTGYLIRKIKDYKLSRYACYLIVQNSDPRKETVVLGQTYLVHSFKKTRL